MATSVQNRKLNQEYIHQIQNEKNERKKELAERSQAEMKLLKQNIQKESQLIDKQASAAVNHIQQKTQAENIEAKQERKEQVQIYSKNLKNQNAQKAQNQSQDTQSQSLKSQNRPAVDSKSLSVASEEASTANNLVSPEADPFYSVQDRGSRILDTNEGYVIEAFAPEHEKDQLQVSILDKKAVISGKRKFQDSIQDESKKITTNNFQTFHEEFKFDRPVSVKGMTKERQGDYIRFFIPKLEKLRFDDET